MRSTVRMTLLRRYDHVPNNTDLFSPSGRCWSRVGRDVGGSGWGMVGLGVGLGKFK